MKNHQQWLFSIEVSMLRMENSIQNIERSIF